MNNATISLIPAVGMMVVGVLAVCWWRRVSGLKLRWFWAGAGLWTVAVALKVLCALVTNAPVIGFMKENMSHPLLVLAGGLYVGIQSSFFEIGLTLLAVAIWRKLARDAGRAIGIGVGAGAFEALLLGLGTFIGILTFVAGLPGTEKVGEAIDTAAGVTPVFWLLAPVERIMAIMCHASSRALVLLGTVHRRPWMVVWGFVVFTLLDAVAGAAHVSGKLGDISLWWIELAILPFALVSIPILKWCYTQWGKSAETQGSLAEGGTSE